MLSVEHTERSNRAKSRRVAYTRKKPPQFPHDVHIGHSLVVFDS